MKNSKKVTATATSLIIDQIAANQSIIDRMVYLWERWQDEKEHENFSDYVTNLEMVALEEGFELLSFTSRPFRASFKAEEGMQAVVTLKSKGNKLQVEGSTEPFVEKKTNGKVGKLKTAKVGNQTVGIIKTEPTEEVAPVVSEGLIFTPLDEVQSGLAAEIEAEFGLTEDEKTFIENNFIVEGEIAMFYANMLKKSNSKIVKSIAEKLHTFVDNASGVMVPTRWLPSIFAAPVNDSTPTVEELEERINDLPVSAKKGRGYANAGKKYGHSGVRVEEFKLGKVKVKKGDKLFFKIGKEEVAGVFSHLNQCVHCPEGYAVIRFNGKNFERRQSRVNVTPTAE